MNKIVSLILCALILTAYSPIVHADPSCSQALPEDISPQFFHISIIAPDLSIGSSGRVVCSGVTRLYSSAQTVEVTVALQKSSQSGWTEVTAWSDKGPGLPGVTLERVYYVTRGTYRVCVTAKAYSETGILLETASAYSYTVTY